MPKRRSTKSRCSSSSGFAELARALVPGAGTGSRWAQPAGDDAANETKTGASIIKRARRRMRATVYPRFAALRAWNMWKLS